MDKGVPLVLSNHAVWGRFHDWMLAQQFRPETIRLYHTVLHDLWDDLATQKVTGPDGAKVPRQWQQIRPRDLQRWLDRPCKPGKWHAGRQHERSTLATYSSKVLAFYRLASVRRWLPGRNPLEDMKAVRRPQRRPRALPLGDVRALLRWWSDDPRMSMVLCLAYYQMLRIGEICRLSVEDIDFAASPPIMRVQRKGGVQAWVEISPGLRPFLRAYLAGRPSSGPLIENHRLPHQHLSPRYASHLLATAMRPIVGDSIHALRHTGASELRAAGVDLLGLQKVLGHASPASTMVYLDDRPGQLAGFLALLPDPLKAAD
jgi:integrase